MPIVFLLIYFLCVPFSAGAIIFAAAHSARLLRQQL